MPENKRSTDSRNESRLLFVGELVDSCINDAKRVPCDCEELWCHHWRDKVVNRIAAALTTTPAAPCVNPNCIDGKVSVGCAINKPLLTVDCPECVRSKQGTVSAAPSDPTQFTTRSFAVVWNEGHNMRLINREGRGAISIPWAELDALRAILGERESK